MKDKQSHGKKAMHETMKSAQRSHHQGHMRGREGHSTGFVTGHDEGVGHGDFANMPQSVIMKAYPPCANRTDSHLDDTITDVDRVQVQGEGRRRSYLSNQK